MKSKGLVQHFYDRSYHSTSVGRTHCVLLQFLPSSCGNVAKRSEDANDLPMHLPTDEDNRWFAVKQFRIPFILTRVIVNRKLDYTDVFVSILSV